MTARIIKNMKFKKIQLTFLYTTTTTTTTTTNNNNNNNQEKEVTAGPIEKMGRTYEVEKKSWSGEM